MLQAPILRFDTLDSTNNYAARLIDADTAQAGLTIVAGQQSAGRGQRGNSWSDLPSQSLLMSIVLQPTMAIDAQFSFLAAVAVAVAKSIQELDESLEVRIKFPNDIIVNDKKAAGILIENSLRGSLWTHAIVGVGVNVLQTEFKNLPNATSLFLESGKSFLIEELMCKTRSLIIENSLALPDKNYIDEYNKLLYKTNETQLFEIDNNLIEVKILGANAQGYLQVQLPDGTVKKLAHGSFSWVW